MSDAPDLDPTARKRIADAMRLRRGHLGLRQTDAAKAAGIGIQTWRILEREEAPRPRGNTLAAVARGLRWPAGAFAEIIEGTNPDNIGDAPEGDDERVKRMERELSLMRRMVVDLADALEELRSDFDNLELADALDELRERESGP